MSQRTPAATRLNRANSRAAPTGFADRLARWSAPVKRDAERVRRSLLHKFQLLPVRDQSTLMRLPQKTPDRFTPFVAVIKRPMIHVHSHELIRQLRAHVARILERMLNR